MINTFEELTSKTRELIESRGKPRAGIVVPGRGKCFEAALKAESEGLIEPVFIGDEPEIRKLTTEAGLDIGRFDIIDCSSNETAVREAVALCQTGRARFLLKGSLGTRELVRLLARPETEFIKRGQVFSHIGIVRTRHYRPLMLITDGAVNNEPDAARMIAITQNAAAMAARLGFDTPRAALLAAVEAIYPAVPVTMEEAAIAKMSDRGQIKGVYIDGPLSFDVAIDAQVARSKGITDSKVAGETNIFVAPSMETANGMYKAMIMYAGAAGAGIIFGGSVPVATTYAVDSTENVINSMMLAAYLALQK